MAKIIVIAVLCLLGATLSKGAFDKEAAIKEFMELSEHCLKDVGAAKSDLDELMKAQPASTKEGKCLRACLMKKYRVLDESGKIQKAVAVEHAQKVTDGDAGKMKIANEVIDACAAIDVPADVCDAAEAYGKCMKEQAEAHGIKKSDFFH